MFTNTLRDKKVSPVVVVVFFFILTGCKEANSSSVLHTSPLGQNDRCGIVVNHNHVGSHSGLTLSSSAQFTQTVDRSKDNY